MIAKLQLFLLSSEPVVSLSVDGGGAVSYDRKGAWEMLKELQKEEKQLLNPNGWMRSIDLSEAF
jgi:hypothetical protein